jgi:hypothetical protein
LRARIALISIAIGFVAATAHADTVADWADITTRIATDGPNTIRTVALTEASVYEAVNAITKRYPRDLLKLGATDGASIDAAIAAASHAVLVHEDLELRPQIEQIYQKMLAKGPDDESRRKGIAVGESAAADVLSKHLDDIGHIEPYRPYTTPGRYVVTTFPLGYAVAQHKPWFLKSASQFRPGPPPSLKSAQWASDYNEVRKLGAVESKERTIEQTNVGRFWATALPDIHVGVVSSLARAPGREVTRNARLFAAVMGALNDTEIAVFETKYHYNFWRPITAIRNGDIDGNPDTERDPDWTPLITTPIQPEYPCAHCMIASAVGTVIRADLGKGAPSPMLSTKSNTLPGVTRSWKSPEDVVAEVRAARVYCGVHYKTSADVGFHMGEEVGKVVAAAYGMQ